MAGKWSFRFVLWYILVLLTQPHFRFPFLIPFHLGDIAIAGGVGLHVINCMENSRPFFFFGPATKLALILMLTGLASHYFNPHQLDTAWNVDIDGIVKVCVVVILLEAQTDTIYKAVAIMATTVVGTLWWIKGGVRLASAGMTWGSGDRLMGANVSIIKNPNDFAYLMVFMIPAYFYFFRICKNRYLRLFFLGCMGSAAYIALETGSRTGFLALATAMALIAPVMWKFYKTTLVGAAIAGILMFSVISGGNIERFKSIKESILVIFKQQDTYSEDVSQVDAESAESRVIKARAAWSVIIDYPLMGVGTNPKPRLFEGRENAGGMVHNEILMAGRHMGLPGMAIYLFAVFMPMVIGLRIHKMAKDYWPEIAALGLTVFTQACIVVVGGMFSPSLFHFPHMLMMTVSAGAYVHLKKLMAMNPGYNQSQTHSPYSPTLATNIPVR
ncbi:MAG: hypothetical protein ACI9TH_001085 [Kiritimatiellia bacterium]|jgi:hypothetical protein